MPSKKPLTPGVLRVTTTVEIDLNDLAQTVQAAAGNSHPQPTDPSVMFIKAEDAAPAAPAPPEMTPDLALWYVAQSVSDASGVGVPDEVTEFINNRLDTTLGESISLIEMGRFVPAGSPSGAFDEFIQNLIAALTSLLQRDHFDVRRLNLGSSFTPGTKFVEMATKLVNTFPS